MPDKPPDPHTLRIAELELALKHERARCAVAEQRAVALEASCRHAYSMALAPRPAREDTSDSAVKDSL